MLFTEWNWDDALEVSREEGRDEGREEQNQYLLELLDQNLSKEEIEQLLKQKVL